MTDQKTKSYYFFRKFWVFMLFLVVGLVSTMAFGFANEFHIVTNRTSWIGTIVLTAILWPLFSALFAGKLAKSVMEGWSPPKGTNPNSKNGLRRLVDTIVGTVKQWLCYWRLEKEDRLKYMKASTLFSLVLLGSFLACYLLGVTPFSQFQAAVIAVGCGIPSLLPLIYEVTKGDWFDDVEDADIVKLIAIVLCTLTWPVIGLVGLLQMRRNDTNPPDRTDKHGIRCVLRANVNAIRSRRHGWHEIKRRQVRALRGA